LSDYFLGQSPSIDLPLGDPFFVFLLIQKLIKQIICICLKLMLDYLAHTKRAVDDGSRKNHALHKTANLVRAGA
jgi:hypothetical protein